MMVEKQTAKLFIPIVLGTARAGRKSEMAAKFVFQELKKRSGIATELIDVRDFPFSATIPSWVEDERAQIWRDVLKKADGLIIVSPEYNHSMPGELKLLLDSAYGEYEKKPVAICGVSSGPYGGARMMASLRIILVQLGLVVIRNTVLFAKIESVFDDKGKPVDDYYIKAISNVFDELVWFAKMLKENRKNKV